MEADTYREAVKTGKETGTCRSIYGNQRVYGHPGLLHTVCGADVSGGCRGRQTIPAVGTDRLCGDAAEKLYACGLDFFYTEKIPGAGIAVYGTAADDPGI